MRFRNKLLLILVGLALLSNGVLVLVSVYFSRELMNQRIRSQVLSIASGAARLVDASAHEKIRAPGDIDTPEYAQIEALLRSIRDANRREDIHVRFVYTLRAVPGQPGKVAYVVDAEERGSNEKSDIGEVYEPKNPDTPPLPLDRNDLQVASDNYGTFLSATSPIRDAAGRPVALLGVDMDIDDVLAQTRRVLWIGLSSMGLAVALAAGLALFVSRRVTHSLDVVTGVVEQIAAGDFDARVSLKSRDEFGTLARVINEMVPQLREGLKLKDSLALAMEVQQALLPSGPPKMAGLDIAGSSVYCDETGGDYYDFLELSHLGPDRLAVAVGDVTGHGVAAALLMTTARALLRSRAPGQGTLAQVMSDINRHLAHDCHAGRFMTLFYLLIDARSRHLQWVSAGHDPAVLYDPASDSFDELAGEDIPMGLDADWKYNEFNRDGFRSGQVLMIGTDGIWESRNSAGQMFGKQRMREVMRATAGLSAAEIAKAVTVALGEFRAGHLQEDDVTMVVVKFTD